MATVLKITNSFVEYAILSVTDGEKLLDIENTTISEITISMSYVLRSPSIISESPLSLLYSNMTVSILDIIDVGGIIHPIINSDSNSKSYFEAINHNGYPSASPVWTIKSATTPTYGNNMSYNVA